MTPIHPSFSRSWRTPPSFLGPDGAAEYRLVIRRLMAMRDLRPPLGRARLIEHCEAVDAGDFEAVNRFRRALHWFERGGRPKPPAGRPRLVVDNAAAVDELAGDDARAHRLMDLADARRDD
jgi:hypothetical protein